MFWRLCNSLIDRYATKPQNTPTIANQIITMFTPGRTNARAATAKHNIDEMSNTIDSKSHNDSIRDKLLALIFSK